MNIKEIIKLGLGVVLSFVSYIAIDYISGGIIGGDNKPTNMQMTAFIDMKDSINQDKAFYRSEISLRDKDNANLKVSLFDNVLARQERKELIGSVKSLELRFNFKPKNILIPSTKKEVTSLLEQCRAENEFCLKLDGELFKESRGHLYIATGLGVTRQSLSSNSFKVGMLAGKPGTDVEVFLDLPKGWNKRNASPEPAHVSSFAWTRLIWEGDDRYGQSVPKSIGGDRGIAENLGIELELESPSLRRLETTLLFFLSAIFGVGFTLVSEVLIGKALTTSRSPENA
ncbi:hypothetical protein [Teredinibacter turnerae]|uniref:hypothetical protein n=1 Tax=Teredinibacter turnerae TaxID=2426 RepID=UPI0030CEEC12